MSFEHEIGSRETEYYKILRTCQANHSNENISLWIEFFFDALQNVQKALLQKLSQSGTDVQLSPAEKSIVTIIANHPGIRSGELSVKLSIPAPTMKRMLSGLLQKGLLQKHGNERSTNYSVA